MSAYDTIYNSYPLPVTLSLLDISGDTPAAPSWFARARAVLANWSASVAESRAESRMWDIAMSDPRVMEKLIQGRQRDDSESLAFQPQSSPAVVMSKLAVPAVKASKAPEVQGLSVLLERVYQSRQRHNRALVAS